MSDSMEDGDPNAKAVFEDRSTGEKQKICLSPSGVPVPNEDLAFYRGSQLPVPEGSDFTGIIFKDKFLRRYS